MNCTALAVLALFSVAVNCDGAVFFIRFILTKMKNTFFSVYFTYGPGVEQWGLISKFCDGDRQSPVDLDTQKAQTVADGKPLELLNICQNPTKVRVYNNGHTGK